MNTFSVTGGCLCGSIRYVVKSPAKCVVHCHCAMCRRSYASLVATAAVVERNHIEIEKGKANLTTHNDSPGGTRQFCNKCGCSVIALFDELPDKAFYYPATLDNGAHPGHPAGSEHHIFLGSKAHWESFSDNLPKHENDLETEAYDRTREEWEKLKSSIGKDS